MTISSTYTPVQYNGNGVTTVFAFPYEFYNSTDLIVKSTVILTGVTTTLTITTDYTVSGGSGSTGNVTFVSAPASTVRITIERAIPYTQTQDYQENTAFPAATLETGLDKAVVMAQQAKAAADLALKFPATDPSTSRGEIPNSVARASALLSFDANGVPSAVTLASLGGAINVSLSSPQNGDALIYNAGTWQNRSTLASLGTNIASATTTAISAADSDFVTVTGTTTITSFGTPASLSRKHIWVVFSGILTLTHNATSLILPGGASITTAAGDVAECVHISGANWRVVTYQRASGQAVVVTSTGPTLVTTATTSGTAIDVTGISSTAKQIIIDLNGVNSGSSGNIALQLGDVGGIETTGYNTDYSSFTSAPAITFLNVTTEFRMPRNNSATQGKFILNLIDSSTNEWGCISIGSSTGNSTSMLSTGTKSLSQTLDRVRLFIVGSPAFNAGKMSVQYF